MRIREMMIADYDALLELLRTTPGVTLRDADSRDATQIYLRRNPGLSFVALDGGKIIGCVMCGHDGRRGYLQHLVVKPEFRNRGFGKNLFMACVDALQRVGIAKTHIFVLKSNLLANRFWSGQGWMLREDLNLYSYNSSGRENV